MGLHRSDKCVEKSDGGKYEKSGDFELDLSLREVRILR